MSEKLSVRPATGSGSALTPPVCLRGHRLKVAGVSRGWDQDYWLPTVCCKVCEAMPDPRPCWALIDPALQLAPGEEPRRERLVLVAAPPAVRGAPGQITLQLNREILGRVTISVCGPCRRAVLEDLQVFDGNLRCGFGTVLLAAALARAPAPTYRWSTVPLPPESPAVLAFWSVVDFPGQLGKAERCTDMRRALGQVE
ncbi:MAG TPA: GNAT family N-acetyltransferase [Amycolatopsis sp.]|nr:GNAT family N-acetyltransferase [Amycolatopsis sp.]